MSGEDRIELDELLAQQDAPAGFRATVEALAGDEERVKVTPYVAGSGCLCSSALAVKRSAIKYLTKTDEIHLCCGKQLMVVEIEFEDETLGDVFGQLLGSTPDEAHAHAAPWEGQASFAPPRLPNVGRPAGPWGSGPMPFHGQNEPFGTGNELRTGALSPYVCALRKVMCDQVCEVHRPGPFDSNQDPTFWYRCICNCENDYASCVNGPNTPPGPCP